MPVEERLPLTRAGELCGELLRREDGLHTTFSARVARGAGVQKLWLCGEGGEPLLLGTLMPLGGGWRLERTVSSGPCASADGRARCAGRSPRGRRQGSDGRRRRVPPPKRRPPPGRGERPRSRRGMRCWPACWPGRVGGAGRRTDAAGGSPSPGGGERRFHWCPPSAWPAWRGRQSATISARRGKFCRRRYNCPLSWEARVRFAKGGKVHG